jgi:hypothetical protein
MTADESFGGRQLQGTTVGGTGRGLEGAPKAFAFRGFEDLCVNHFGTAVRAVFS